MPDYIVNELFDLLCMRDITFDEDRFPSCVLNEVNRLLATFDRYIGRRYARALASQALGDSSANSRTRTSNYNNFSVQYTCHL